ncbi:helix-turn-helix domain-containing protein [Herbiconiux sp. CPCC 205716]|uniref:Helix-turn-helix domain-containing protein n=1 Tax=Herbiconiux gentiana TaxID=2970912 RepID=A0ABT2GF47_9MICO|nr:helix-turn-helix domain-containing protein [Herbiconiux gentiana]MCS5714257.1 helix-turn-helix domain-containing protein [Herbiconiux gentiana]
MSLPQPAQQPPSADGIARRALERLGGSASDARSRPTIRLVVGGDAEPVEIPTALEALVIEALEGLAAGRRMRVLDADGEVTTTQAAELLNVSRPHLVKLLERGVIAHRRVGSHRRVDVASLLDFKASETARSHAAADELVQLGQESGTDR